MSIPVTMTKAVSQFRCIGDRCPDTCCKGWGMQLSAKDVALYAAEAPELLDAVTSGEAEFVMKRDPASDYCVKFEGGWCAIHKQYGERMLGDACHFFPRITRSLGGKTVMTASLACPELARISLSEDAPSDEVQGDIERVPHAIREYGSPELPAETMRAVHRAFITHIRDPQVTAERAFAHVASVARSLAMIESVQWEAAVPFYLKMADGRLPAPEPLPADPFNVLNALLVLIAAAPKSERAGLMETIATIRDVLKIEIDHGQITIGDETGIAYLAMQAHWRTHCAALAAPILKRWMEAQFSAMLFPFAGLGRDALERITIIGVRFATVKLALAAESMRAGAFVTEEVRVRVVQSIARFMDHLADPEFSMQIYRQLGWDREGRLRSLVGDIV